jgi:hypothetical protein
VLPAIRAQIIRSGSENHSQVLVTWARLRVQDRHKEQWAVANMWNTPVVGFACLVPTVAVATVKVGGGGIEGGGWKQDW